MRPLQIYIHIPFCVRKCAYCDFLSFAAEEETKRAYIRMLLRDCLLYTSPSPRDA